LSVVSADDELEYRYDLREDEDYQLPTPADRQEGMQLLLF